MTGVAWLLPVAGLVVFFAALVWNQRRVRTQRFGTLSSRRAVPTRLVVLNAVATMSMYLAGLVALAALSAVFDDRAAAWKWWTLSIAGVIAVLAFVIKSRLLVAMNRARQPYR